MPTLIDRIERAAGRPRGITFVGAATRDRVPYGRLHEDALAMAAALQANDVGPGSHVAILGTTSRSLVTAIQATWLSGATLVVLPLPMRLGSLEDFVVQTRARLRSADASLVIVASELVPFLDPVPGDPPILCLDELAAAKSAARYRRPDDDPSRLAVLQFTSGSTGDPKGVMLPHETICENLDAAAASAMLDPDVDVLVSWLPLYHDMGLLGLLALPMTIGADLVLGTPQDFMGAPSRWMEWMSAYGGTATAGPNFSYALAARALGRLSGLDLSRWRIALNGAEPVDPANMEAFIAAGAPHGLSPSAAFPAFGMAEVVIAGSFPDPGSGLCVDAVDLRSLEDERRAIPVTPGNPRSRRLARLGRPVRGLEFRIVEPGGDVVLGGRDVGELEIRGTSVTPGYYRHPQATHAAFHDGWLRTGDLAYLVDGELVVCGRLKDVIIVAGRNLFPEDVERAVADVDGVRAGNVIAFGVEGRKGREGLVVVAEVKDGPAGAVRQAVARRVRDSVGISPAEVVLVTAGTLPKTSSGKLQRSLCRVRYLDSVLQPIG